jgi:hypothetical protein
MPSKYVEYSSEEYFHILNIWKNSSTNSKFFSKWAEHHKIKVNWYSDCEFLEFENEQSKLAFLLRG